MKKKIFVLLSLLMIVSMLLVSCGPADEEPTETEEPPASEELAVGIVLPTKDEPRWIQDQARFESKLSEAGYDVEILFSQADPSMETVSYTHLTLPTN